MASVADLLQAVAVLTKEVGGLRREQAGMAEELAGLRREQATMARPVAWRVARGALRHSAAVAIQAAARGQAARRHLAAARAATRIACQARSLVARRRLARVVAAASRLAAAARGRADRARLPALRQQAKASTLLAAAARGRAARVRLPGLKKMRLSARREAAQWSLKQAETEEMEAKARIAMERKKVAEAQMAAETMVAKAKKAAAQAMVQAAKTAQAQAEAQATQAVQAVAPPLLSQLGVAMPSPATPPYLARPAVAPNRAPEQPEAELKVAEVMLKPIAMAPIPRPQAEHTIAKQMTAAVAAVERTAKAVALQSPLVPRDEPRRAKPPARGADTTPGHPIPLADATNAAERPAVSCKVSLRPLTTCPFSAQPPLAHRL